MKFLIDENVRNEVKDFLKSNGHDILEAVPASKDETIAKTAKEGKRIILTHDRHFADILMYPPEKYPGIIRIKIHPPSVPIIINALSKLFDKLSGERIDKKLIILEKDSFRIR